MKLTEAQVELVWRHVERELRDLWPHLDQLDLQLSAVAAGRRIGFRTGNAFESWLCARDLPRFREIRDGCYLVRIHALGLAAGSMGALAEVNGCYPSVYTRFIKRVYGAGWRELRSLRVTEVRRYVASVWAAARPRLLVQSSHARLPHI
jgi:hypothetical protein